MSRFLYLPNNVIAKQRAIQAGTQPMYLRMPYDKYIMRGVWFTMTVSTFFTGVGLYRMITGQKPTPKSE
ncbi:hypothetical protein BT69DRAFT_275854 [Atractiella rhizophila]|nr:hypothetical protein BT69DRAFT_275854 [Atractiella rhizophila]